jgi:class 3 adenylate cyclase
MANAKEIREEVAAIFATKWDQRAGQVVPDSNGVKLGNDAVNLNATVLYADLADSTELVNGYKAFFAAEVYKSYLLTACRIIRDEGGEITAFDGDRVMAVFLGESKNSEASRVALRINWAVRNLINPAIRAKYPQTSFEVRQGVGIDTSSLFVAKTGIRGSNDLVWVGRAANYAAKLSVLRYGNYSSFITEDVFNLLSEKSKFGGTPRRPMWEKLTWSETGLTIYGSTWWWEIS